jgi:hypothetical protein
MKECLIILRKYPERGGKEQHWFQAFPASFERCLSIFFCAARFLRIFFLTSLGSLSKHLLHMGLLSHAYAPFLPSGKLLLNSRDKKGLDIAVGFLFVLMLVFLAKRDVPCMAYEMLLVVLLALELNNVLGNWALALGAQLAVLLRVVVLAERLPVVLEVRRSLERCDQALLASESARKKN